MQRIENLFRAHPKAAPAVFIGLAIFILGQAGYYLANWAAPRAVGLHTIFEMFYFACFLAGVVYGWARRGARTG